jgi:hypothetical protein
VHLLAPHVQLELIVELELLAIPVQQVLTVLEGHQVVFHVLLVPSVLLVLILVPAAQLDSMPPQMVPLHVQHVLQGDLTYKLVKLGA